MDISFEHPGVEGTTPYTPDIKGPGLPIPSGMCSGFYRKHDGLVTVYITAQFTAVTNFGTDQYQLTLPFAARDSQIALGFLRTEALIAINTDPESRTLIGGITAVGSSWLRVVWFSTSQVLDTRGLVDGSPWALDSASTITFSFSYEATE